MAVQAQRVPVSPESRLQSSRVRRSVANDYPRTFIIVLVLVHHSMLAYVGFGQFNRLHYLFVIWLQYALLNAHLSAIAGIILTRS
jgi:hypothetical protein